MPLRIEKEHYLAGLADIAGTEWRVAMLVPYSDVASITNKANRILLVSIVLILLVLIPLARIFTRSITRPITNLQKGVDAISVGDYSVVIPENGSEEFARVIESFNTMTRRTKEMMARQYAIGQSLKSAELQVLQEQINPHFLYNTLDLIHWQARRADAKDIDNVVHALSQFYRLSLGHGEEIVSLEHELQHVTA